MEPEKSREAMCIVQTLVVTTAETAKTASKHTNSKRDTECAFALVAQLQLENLASRTVSAIAGGRRARLFWVEAKLGQRKVREQAGASLVTRDTLPDLGNSLDMARQHTHRRMERSDRGARADGDDVSGTERQSRCPGPQEGMSELRGIDNLQAPPPHRERDGDVFGDRKPKLGHRLQEVIPGQQGIVMAGKVWSEGNKLG
ncbi:hypothetical protein B0H14DRAFT_2583522 [Mycena olivaceomarginata]|nr:hypothetical protein B0H14DRAFT_2583522 [Mycena olivaceomarginata]